MTKEEFIKQYCKRSGISWEVLSEFNVALPCNCGEEICKGWAMVSNDPELIEDHMKFSAPKE